MRALLVLFFLFVSLLLFATEVNAQFSAEVDEERVISVLEPEIEIATDSATVASLSAEEQAELDRIRQEDITKPEEIGEREEYLALFANRPIESPGIFNFTGYAVQYAVREGVPANTIMLILLLPFLATLAVFVRHIIGLPSLEMIVPIALSITLVSTGISAGAVLLITILLASTIARLMLKKIRIMQLPKMALSIFVVSIFVFISLTVSASVGMLTVTQLSIFPVLLLILLGEKIVSLQLSRSAGETFQIATVTILMGLLGFAILQSEMIRRFILLYPEVIYLLIPLNILMGRYFGLRLTEVYRFSKLRKYANQ